MKKIVILGLGYVGLPLALAIKKSSKYEVLGFDISTSRILAIKNKSPEVVEMVGKNELESINLKVSSSPQDLQNSDYFIICVPTPVDKMHNTNLGPVLGALELVAKFLQKNNTVIIESTINPGVCEEVAIPLLEKQTGLKSQTDFDLAHCPERINPGDLKWNVCNIPRNVGATSSVATKKVAKFYRSFVNAKVNEMSCLKEVEATKIIENIFRDVNIAFVNELAISFDILGINLINAIKGASNKPFGFMPHYPSCGVGGHCIPVDPYYLINRAKESNFEHSFLSMARTVNNFMPTYAVEKLVLGFNEIGKSIKNSKIGLMGLSYKANVGDLRESPALVIKNILEQKYKATLEVFDPYFPKLSTCNNLIEFLAKCEAVVLTVNHDEFLTLKPKYWQNVKIIVDGKNCLDPNLFSSSGQLYLGIGR
jgi:UDP-N-acetyl-D-glucosamine dehydrogenase